MNLLVPFLLLALQGDPAAEEKRELRETITELKAVLDETPGEERRHRIRASIDRLQARLRHLKAGKVRPEPENEEEELARMLRMMTDRIKANPSDAEAWMERAEINTHLGNHEAALADSTQAVKLIPGEAYPHVFRARALLELGREAEAQKAFAKAFELEPGIEEDLRELIADIAPERGAKMMKAAMKMAAGPSADPAEVAHRLKENPADVEALVFRARHRIDKKNLDGAFDDLYEAIRLDPREARAYFVRALAHAVHTEDHERPEAVAEAQRLRAVGHQRQ